MSARIRLSTASDYAALEIGSLEFYYGYEFVYPSADDAENEDTWGFEVKGGDRPARWSYRDLVQGVDRAPDLFEPTECLLIGIARWIGEA